MKLAMGLLVLLLFVPMLPSSASAQVSVKLTFDLRGVPAGGMERSGLPVQWRRLRDKDNQYAR